MIEPRLNYVPCPGAAAAGSDAPGHRMAYWEWNATGQPAHPHVIVCVHGLSRQGRDFDQLARALCGQARVVCPDVVGRGRSDWLADPQGYQVPLYAADMLALLAQLHAQGPIGTLDWVGTSMGGLIGMVLAGTPDAPLPVSLHRLVLNDVGPTIEWKALERIGQYLGAPAHFDTVEQGADALWASSSTFGPHTREQWLALSRPMLKPAPQGGWTLHYDPAIAVPYAAMTEQGAREGEQLLWKMYQAITAQVLVLHGAQSDLLTAQTVQRMLNAGPQAQVATFDGVGHAPTLVADDQVRAVQRFLLGAQAAGGQ